MARVRGMATARATARTRFSFMITHRGMFRVQFMVRAWVRDRFRVRLR